MDPLPSLLAPSALATLMPSPASPSISLLRLRFRFGSPRRVLLDQVFHLTVDLVDEMAQPPATSCSLAHKIRICITLAPVDTTDLSGLVLRTRMVQTSSARPFHWRVDCILSSTDSTLSPLPSTIRLLVTCEATSPLLSVPSPLPTLQRFCVDAQWLPLSTDASSLALVLPVLSDDIALITTSEPLPPSPNSPRRLRVFALPSRLGRVFIEEDYGHAMGAHIWDASIWLSLALSLLSPRLTGSVVELGAGCGLVACVLARLSVPNNNFSIVATERRDALPLLQANVVRNGVSSIVQSQELLWGSLSSQLPATAEIVLAADVLYHWSSHEALLATLLHTTSTTSQVLIAHKRRSQKTSQRLENVLSTGVDDQCGTNCTWRQWRVERLAQLVGDVDLLRLIKRP